MTQAAKLKVLNVGGNSKDIALPDIYQDWEQIFLDIDPTVNPDVVCDARELFTLEPATYDAIYCSHNLEHYYRHEIPNVLRGFAHVLKEDSFVHIRVPDMTSVLRAFVELEMDINDPLYKSSAGDITIQDIIYGLGTEIERSGCDFFAHKTGFTEQYLLQLLKEFNFPYIFSGVGGWEIAAFAFKNQPSENVLVALGLAAP
jgi:SAM-dependent methyltransferase